MQDRVFIKFPDGMVSLRRHGKIRADCLGLFDSEVVQISDIGRDIFNLKWKFTFSGGTEVERGST